MFLNNSGSSEEYFDEGVIVEVVREHKEWIVRVYGIYWHARSQHISSFKSGDIIRVVGRSGIKLLIEPA